MLLLATLGVLAGLITTLSGFGGGLLLVTALALLWDPLTALTLSSLALVFGNAQRLWLFRHDWDRRLALPVVAGAIPGALAGALVATRAPAWILQVAIVVMTSAATLRLVAPSRICLPRRLLAPGACGVGLLSATTGGGGFLLGPLLLSAGLSGGRYIAVGSSTGTAIHLFRIAGYSSTGIIDFSLLSSVAVITFAILIGNFLGRRIPHSNGGRPHAMAGIRNPDRVRRPRSRGLELGSRNVRGLLRSSPRPRPPSARHGDWGQWWGEAVDDA